VRDVGEKLGHDIRNARGGFAGAGASGDQPIAAKVFEIPGHGAEANHAVRAIVGLRCARQKQKRKRGGRARGDGPVEEGIGKNAGASITRSCGNADDSGGGEMKSGVRLHAI